jgi:hypothetical protein
MRMVKPPIYTSVGRHLVLQIGYIQYIPFIIILNYSYICGQVVLTLHC